MMSGGIAGRIAFRFHDATADPPFRQIVNHDFADQKPREFQCVAGKFFSGETAKLETRGFHGLLRAYIGRLVVKQAREFRMVDYYGWIRLNGVEVFLLKGVARLGRGKHFARE